MSEEVINIAALVKNRELREDALVAFFEQNPELLEATLEALNSRKFKKAELAAVLYELLEAVKKSRTAKPKPEPAPTPKAKVEPKAEVATEAKPKAEPKVKAEVPRWPEVFPTFPEPVKAYLRGKTKVVKGEVTITFPEKDGKEIPPRERIWKMLCEKGARNSTLDYFRRGQVVLVIRKKKH